MIVPRPARMTLRVHAFLPASFANGPGCRAVVWTQGCSLKCPGCFNPASHAFGGGSSVSVLELAARIRAQGRQIEGVTISGGEPLLQWAAVTELLRQIKTSTELSVLLLTGFTWEEVLAMPTATAGVTATAAVTAGVTATATRPAETGVPGLSVPPAGLLGCVDVLIAGRYDRRRHLAHGLRGSDNKTVHLLTDRYSADDLDHVPSSEAIVEPDGQVVVTGMNPLQFTQ